MFYMAFVIDRSFCLLVVKNEENSKEILTWTPGGGGNLSLQDTGLCHSNRESTTHKSGEISQKYTHKSGEISQKYTHKSGEFLKIMPINPGMPKQLTNKPINEF